ncbi:MAG TPA: hypothetical protein PKX03_02300, partial [Candidatus Paceibacterota bacterium]|nr:hypothetical protein [Candidatus Paceibacterota bacterium]
KPFAEDLKVAAQSLKEFFKVIQTSESYKNSIQNIKNSFVILIDFIVDNKTVLLGLGAAYIAFNTTFLKTNVILASAVTAVEALTYAYRRLDAYLNVRTVKDLNLQYQQTLDIYNHQKSAIEQNTKVLKEYQEMIAKDKRAGFDTTALEKGLIVINSEIQKSTKNAEIYKNKLQELELALGKQQKEERFEPTVSKLINELKDFSKNSTKAFEDAFKNITAAKVKEINTDEFKNVGSNAAKKFQEGFDFERAIVNKFNELNKIAAIGIDSQSIISDTTKSEVLAAIEILKLYKEKGFEINQALVDSIVKSVRKGREEISKLTFDALEAVVNKFDELNKIAAIGIDSKNIISDTTKSEVMAAIEILQLYKEKGIEVNQALVDSIVESVRKGREEINNFAMKSIIDDDFLTNLQAAEEKYTGVSGDYFEKANQEKLANQQKFFTALTSATSRNYKTLFNVIKVAEASIGLINAYGAAV